MTEVGALDETVPRDASANPHSRPFKRRPPIYRMDVLRAARTDPDEALRMAAEAGFVRLIPLLVQRRARLLPGADGLNALDISLRHGKIEFYHALIEAHPQANDALANGAQPGLFGRRPPDPASTMLMSGIVQVGYKPGPMWRRIHTLAHQGDVEGLRAYKHNPNLAGILAQPGEVLLDGHLVQGITAAHVSAMKGDLRFLSLLKELEDGVDRPGVWKAFFRKPRSVLDLQDSLGRTPLHYAAFSGREDVVRWLLAKGVRQDPLDESGFTPFDFARQNLFSPNSVKDLLRPLAWPKRLLGFLRNVFDRG